MVSAFLTSPQLQVPFSEQLKGPSVASAGFRYLQLVSLAAFFIWSGEAIFMEMLSNAVFIFFNFPCGSVRRVVWKTCLSVDSPVALLGLTCGIRF